MSSSILPGKAFLVNLNLMGSCSLVFTNTPTGPQPTAVIGNFDDAANEVDSTGSIGDQVRLRIVRNNVVIQTTPGLANTGTTNIPYTGDLQNGDRLCVQATYSGFATYDEACGDIPTPEFGFTPIS